MRRGIRLPSSEVSLQCFYDIPTVIYRWCDIIYIKVLQIIFKTKHLLMLLADFSRTMCGEEFGFTSMMNYHSYRTICGAVLILHGVVCLLI